MRHFFLLVTAMVLVASASAWSQGYTLKAPLAEKPAFLTSVGQSADLDLVKVLLERAAIPYKAEAQAKASDLAASGAKTLVLVVGGSTKGLGAAGVSADVELERTKAIIVQARKLGMTIIGLHVGGKSRRGELSDKFIQAAVPSCNYVIVVAEGDEDGYFGKLCGGKIPLDKVERMTKAVEPLQKAFK